MFVWTVTSAFDGDRNISEPWEIFSTRDGAIAWVDTQLEEEDRSKLEIDIEEDRVSFHVGEFTNVWVIDRYLVRD